jgi:hypothetical protein
MRIVRREAITEYYAKKRAIDAVIRFFQKKPDTFFVALVASWNDDLHKLSGESEVVARREIISQFFGIDFVVSQHRDLSKFAPRSKSQYLELWDGLVRHEIKDPEVLKGRDILRDIEKKGIKAFNS